MHWFWYFALYSFLGFLLETAFAKLSHGRPDRKCLLVLPLCPVYGLGACASLAAAPLARGNPAALFLIGAAACTAAEYLAAVWYERWAGVSFWDYAGQAGNLRGKVCLPFSALWGALVVAMVYWVHPAVARLVSAIPRAVTVGGAAALCADMAVSHILLRRTGDRACLRWYEGILSGGKREKA